MGQRENRRPEEGSGERGQPPPPACLACSLKAWLAQSKRSHGCRNATCSMVCACSMQLGAGTSAICRGARECSMQGGVRVWCSTCWARAWSLLHACEFHTPVCIQSSPHTLGRSEQSSVDALSHRRPGLSAESEACHRGSTAIATIATLNNINVSENNSVGLTIFGTRDWGPSD